MSEITTAEAPDARQGITRESLIHELRFLSENDWKSWWDRRAQRAMALAADVLESPRVDRPRWDDDLRAQDAHPDPVPDVTFDHPITVAGTPAEQRHREEKP